MTQPPNQLDITDQFEKLNNQNNLTALQPIGSPSTNSGQPPLLTHCATQQPIPRFHDYALQRNSAVTTDSRIPHTLTSTKWTSPLSSPPPPWSPSLSTGQHSFISSVASPYPLETSLTTPSLFSDYPDIASVPMLPEVSKEPVFREQRSMSYSIEGDNRETLDPWHYQQQQQHYINKHNKPTSLYTMPEETMDTIPPSSPFGTPFFNNPHYQDDTDEDSMLAAFHRTRSKSSAPAFDIWYPSSTSSESTTRWLHQPTNSHQHAPAPLYTPFLSSMDRERLGPPRRFSVQPSLEQPPIPVKDSTSDSLIAFSRRHSVAGPTFQQDESAYVMSSLENSIDELTNPQTVPPTSTLASPTRTIPSTTATTTTTSSTPAIPITTTTAATTAAKTTVAPVVPMSSSTTSTTNSKGLYAKVAAAGLSDSIDHPVTPSPLPQQPQSKQLQHQKQKQQSQVESTSPSSSSSSLTTSLYTLPKSEDMGRGVKLESIPKEARFYMVEFKAGRTDLFFSLSAVKKGDFVMVEADRGHDLGKVTTENINSTQLSSFTQQQRQQESQEEDTTMDQPSSSSSSQQRSDIRIKRLFRLARPEEISLLMSKSQDELKALSTCQTKVQQRKLNISVVNAEYQWDRRKLTFYFVADRRVDFRELVRELFKLYKTRIWMCDVNSVKTT